MEKLNHKIGTEKLVSVTRAEMERHKLISSCEQISLVPHHPVTVHGKQRTHYIISCCTSQKRFFLKIQKGGDSAGHCNAFLRRFQTPDGKCCYPLLVIPEFSFYEDQYSIYTFAEGETLENILKHNPEQEYSVLAEKLLARLDELGSVQAPQYSNQNRFVSEGFGDIMKEKIRPKLSHSAFSDIPPETIDKLVLRCAEILNAAHFSSPTLLHMDIKPANVIYDEQTQTLSLIDFELSRFGDTDYGWTQILLTALKPYGEVYRTCFFPKLIKDKLSLEEALSIPKYQCYIFYQIACNLIYYYEHGEAYPEKLYALFLRLVATLST